MPSRRVAARLGAGLAVLGFAVIGLAWAVAPAAAAPKDHTVTIRDLSDSFRANGDPGSLNVVVSRRERGCTLVRRALTVRLNGLSDDQLRVERRIDGEWRRVRLAPAGDGAWTAFDRAPDPDRLCRGDDSVGRYRIAFLAGAPSGDAEFVAQAFGGFGAPLGSDSAARRVDGRAKVSPTPSPSAPKPTPSATPSPTAVPTTAAPVQPTRSDTPGALLPVVAQSTTDPGFGGGVMVLGGAMVAVGVGLLVLLLRRNLSGSGQQPGPADPDGSGPGGPGGGDPNPTLILPTTR